MLSLLVDDRLYAALSPHARFWGRVAPLIVLALSALTSWQGLRRSVYHNSGQALRRARLKVEHLLQETHTAKVQRQIEEQHARIDRACKAAPVTKRWFFGAAAEYEPQTDIPAHERFAMQAELKRLEAQKEHRLDFEYMDRALGTLHDRARNS